MRKNTTSDGATCDGVMLCLCYVMLCCVMLRCVVLCYIILCCVMLCYVMLSAVPSYPWDGCLWVRPGSHSPGHDSGEVQADCSKVPILAPAPGTVRAVQSCS